MVVKSVAEGKAIKCLPLVARRLQKRRDYVGPSKRRQKRKRENSCRISELGRARLRWLRSLGVYGELLFWPVTRSPARRHARMFIHVTCYKAASYVTHFKSALEFWRGTRLILVIRHRQVWRHPTA